MNELQKMETRTPIEIALDIDKDGMTTARKLYAFLELASGQFSRWAKTNIIENEFAEENVDYWGFDINVEGNQTMDFKLTAHFAKKLSCKGSGEKGEQAREYFTTLEERVKQKAIDHSQLSPQMKLLYGLCDQLAQAEREAKEAKQIADSAKGIAQKAVETTESIKEAVKPVLDNWREEVNKKFNRIQRNADKPFNLLRSEMYSELERRAGCDLSTRLRNKKQRMSEGAFTKKQINDCNRMDIIEEDKKLREIFSKIVSEYEIKYCA